MCFVQSSLPNPAAQDIEASRVNVSDWIHFCGVIRSWFNYLGFDILYVISWISIDSWRSNWMLHLKKLILKIADIIELEKARQWKVT